MTRGQRRLLPLSTEKKWEAATSRSTRRGPGVSAPRAAIGAADAPVVVAVAANSRTRTTESPPASRASHAGSRPATRNEGSVVSDFLGRPLSETFQKRQ